MGPTKRAESSDGGQTGKHDRFDHACQIARDIGAALPHQQNINAVINPDRQNKTEGKHIQQVQRHVQQLHRRDHCRDGKRERNNLN